ncbi:MAG: glycosyltransferase [Actinomyces urogenitalis]|uniref:glycosyltransferase family 2 protein n=1 Tax=Actinomyces urogenitalis TaxID=103621 RepID=UPI002A82819C|nr:glycosyltransferase [Actinomyces urogenitalis]MDY3677849.1 glycosyltransferase [Actinomyces urogenitalis]
MRTSVIIPCHNSVGTVPLQLEALARQEGAGQFEVVLVDNCSTDALAAVYEEWADRLETRLVVAGEYANVSYARNCGARQARGDLLLFLDADDYAPPHFVAYGQQALKRDVPIYAAGFLPLPPEVFERGPEALCEALAREGHPEGDCYVPPDSSGQSLQWPILPGGAFGVRRDFFERLGGFDLDAAPGAEDNDLAIRSMRAGHTPPVLSCTTIAYRVDPGRVRTRGARRQALLSAVRVQQRHHLRPPGTRRPSAQVLRALAAGGLPRSWVSPASRQAWRNRVDESVTVWLGHLYYGLLGQLPPARVGVGLEGPGAC